MIKQIRNSAVGYFEIIREKTGNIAVTTAIVGLAFAVVILIASVIPFVVGWALLTIISIFTIVGVTGYWATVAVGLAALIIAVIIS